MTTTLNKLRAHRPCEYRWKKLLKNLGKTQADDEPLQLSTILESNGIKDAIWALRSLNDVDKELRLFACDCAEGVLYLFENAYPKDNRPRNAIETARKYAQGTATKEELNANAAFIAAYYANADANAAYYAADAIANAATYYAAYYAATAAYYAANATYYANAYYAANAAFIAAADAAYYAANAAANAAAIKTIFLKYFGN